MSFKLAFAVPIQNHKLDMPQFVSFHMTGGEAVGGSYITVAQDSPAFNSLGESVNLRNILRHGDTIILTDREGQSEHLLVDRITEVLPAIADNIFYIYTQTTNTLTYYANDTGYAYGTGWPKYWHTDTDEKNKFNQSSIVSSPGFNNTDYAFRFSVKYMSRYSLPNVSEFIYSFPYNPFKESVFYRAGFFLKRDIQNLGLSGSAIEAEINDGGYDSTAITDSNLLIGNNSDGMHRTKAFYAKNDDFGGALLSAPISTDNYLWKECFWSFTSNKNLNKDTSYYYKFYFKTGFSSSNLSSDNESIFWLTKPYIEHASGLEAKTEVIRGVVIRGKATSGSFQVFDDSDFSVGQRVSVYDKDGSDKYAGTITYIDSTNNRMTISFSNLPTADSTDDARVSWESGAIIEGGSAGYYAFTEYPNMDTSWQFIKSMNTSRTQNNSLIYQTTSPWGSRSKKIMFTLKYDNVDYTFYKKLKKFEDYCEDGGLVNFHYEETDFPELGGDDFIQGKIELSAVIHNIFDREKCSFTLVVMEA